MVDWGRIERLLGWHRFNEERLAGLQAEDMRLEGVLEEIKEGGPKGRHAETFGELALWGESKAITELAAEGAALELGLVRSRAAVLRGRQEAILFGLKDLGMPSGMFIPYGPSVLSGDRFVRLLTAGSDSPIVGVVSGGALRSAKPDLAPWEIELFDEEVERYARLWKLERVKMWGSGTGVLTGSVKMLSTGVLFAFLTYLIVNIFMGVSDVDFVGVVEQVMSNPGFGTVFICSLIMAVSTMAMGTIGLAFGLILEAYVFVTKRDHMLRVSRAARELGQTAGEAQDLVALSDRARQE